MTFANTFGYFFTGVALMVFSTVLGWIVKSAGDGIKKHSGAGYALVFWTFFLVVWLWAFGYIVTHAYWADAFPFLP